MLLPSYHFPDIQRHAVLQYSHLFCFSIFMYVVCTCVCLYARLRVCVYASFCVCFCVRSNIFFLIFTVKIIQIFRRVWSVAKRAAVLWSVAKCIVAVYGQRRRWRLCGQEFDTAMIYSQSLGGQCEELRRRMNT